MKNVTMSRLGGFIRGIFKSSFNKQGGHSELDSGSTAWVVGHLHCASTIVYGFTLIELLVVVIIIGILAAIAVPQYQKVVDKSRYVQLQSNVEALLKAQQLYYMANGVYATTFAELGDDAKPAGYSVDKKGNWTRWKGNELRDYIVIGLSTDRTEASYLYAREQGAHVAYWTSLSGKSKRCLAYPEGGERGKAVCKSVTGRSTPSRTGADGESYDF